MSYRETHAKRQRARNVTFAPLSGRQALPYAMGSASPAGDRTPPCMQNLGPGSLHSIPSAARSSRRSSPTPSATCRRRIQDLSIGVGYAEVAACDAFKELPMGRCSRYRRTGGTLLLDTEPDAVDAQKLNSVEQRQLPLVHARRRRLGNKRLEIAGETEQLQECVPGCVADQRCKRRRPAA